MHKRLATHATMEEVRRGQDMTFEMFKGGLTALNNAEPYSGVNIVLFMKAWMGEPIEHSPDFEKIMAVVDGYLGALRAEGIKRGIIAESGDDAVHP